MRLVAEALYDHRGRRFVGGNGTAWSSSNVGFTYMRIDTVGTLRYLTAA